MGIWGYVGFQYHSSLYTKQEPSYPGKIALESIWFTMVSTQKSTQVYKDSLTLTYPANINILTGITILIPMGRFFGISSYVDYWYHAFTYKLVQHCLIPSLSTLELVANRNYIPYFRSIAMLTCQNVNNFRNLSSCYLMWFPCTMSSCCRPQYIMTGEGVHCMVVVT